LRPAETKKNKTFFFNNLKKVKYFEKVSNGGTRGRKKMTLPVGIQKTSYELLKIKNFAGVPFCKWDQGAVLTVLHFLLINLLMEPVS
jgi:hypothetical protein